MTWNEGRTRYDIQKRVSDDLGEFEFDNVAGGQKELVAYYKDLASRKSRYKGEPVELAADGKTYPPITLKLVKTPRIVVRVVNASDDKPVADALVHLVWSDGERDQRTDAGGEATLVRLTHEVWHVEVKAKGFAQQVQAINLAETETARVTVELTPGAVLEGTVRDEAGAPVAGAGISVFPADFQGGQIEYLTTDPSGKYRFDYLPVDKGLLLMISHDGFVDAREPVTLSAAAAGEASEKSLDLVLKTRPHGGTVKGTVTDRNGKPIAGATLRNSGWSSRDVRRATTDASGQFILDDVFEGPRRREMVVKAKGFAPNLFSLEPGTREKPEVRSIVLQPGHHIRGRVVDADGRPVDGARVSASGGDGGDMDIGDYVTTDSEGRFTFDSLLPDATFRISKDGYSELDDQHLVLDGDEEIVVTLESAAVIHGRVVDAATGRPVPVFNVMMTFSPDRQAGDPGSHLSGARSTSPEGERFAPSDGAFVLGDLVRGMPLQVMVAAEGYDRVTMRRVVARPAEDAETVEFRLAPVDQAGLFEIKGRIVDSESRPIAAAELRLIVAEKRSFPRDAFPFNWQMIKSGQVSNNDGVQQYLSTTSDQDGNFVFRGVRPGKDIELIYWGDGISQGRMERVERLTPAERGAMKIAGVTPGALRGRVDRQALPDVIAVMLMPRGGTRGSDYYRDAVSSNDIDYEIRNVPPGGYELQVYGKPNRSTGGGESDRETVLRRERVEIASGETLTFDLGAEPAATATTSAAALEKRTAEPIAVPIDNRPLTLKSTAEEIVIAGRVVDNAGRPVEGARLWLPVGANAELSDSNFAETSTDEQGRFTLSVPREWLEPDASTPSATIWCYMPGKCIATASAFKQLRRNSTEPIAIVLPPASDTGFTVTDPKGKPVAGARVEPWHFHAGSYDIVPTPLRAIIGSETDGQGQVKMFAMSRDGFMTVQVTADGYGTQLQRLRDVASEPAMRNIQLRVTGRIEGQLVSDDATAIARLRIYVYQEDFMGEHTAGSAIVPTDEAGKFEIKHFAEGPIHLIVRNDDKSPLRPQTPEKLEVFAGETTDVSIPLVVGVPVQGVVRTKEGHRPVPGALVSVQYGSFQQGDQMRTDEKGQFRTTVLPGQMRQTLISRPENFIHWVAEKVGWEAPVEISAGASEVELPPIELIETVEHRGRLIDQTGKPVANGRLSAVIGNRNLAMAMTDDDGAFGIWLPNEPAIDSYNVHLSRDEPRYEVRIVDEDPLVLQIER